jgi:hypothetical protein
MLDPTFDTIIKAIPHFSSEHKKRSKARADVMTKYISSCSAIEPVSIRPAVLLSQGNKVTT